MKDRRGRDKKRGKERNFVVITPGKGGSDTGREASGDFGIATYRSDGWVGVDVSAEFLRKKDEAHKKGKWQGGDLEIHPTQKLA
jgi:hypothetical protein